MKTKLNIRLTEPILFMRGNSWESVGGVMRGDLLLQLAKPTRVRKLELRFQGRSTTNWPQGIGNLKLAFSEENILTDRVWSFLPLADGTTVLSDCSDSTSSLCQSSRDSTEVTSRHHGIFHLPLHLGTKNSDHNPQYEHLLEPGLHIYAFEHVLPGSTPESVETSMGRVDYELIAVVERVGLVTPNLHARHPVTIVRELEAHIDVEGVNMSKAWGRQMLVEVSLPRRSYPLGTFIPIDLMLRLLSPHVKILRLHVRLVEETVLSATGGETSEYCEEVSALSLDEAISRMYAESGSQAVAASQRHEGEGQTSTPDSSGEGDNFIHPGYHSNISLPLPFCASSFLGGPTIHFSCTTPYITVSHRLDFTIRVSCPPITPEAAAENRSHQTYDLHFKIPVIILSCRCAVEDHVILPRYEDRNFLCPCDPRYRDVAAMLSGQKCEMSSAYGASEEIHSDAEEVCDDDSSGGDTRISETMQSPPMYEDVVRAEHNAHVGGEFLRRNSAIGFSG